MRIMVYSTVEDESMPPKRTIKADKGKGKTKYARTATATMPKRDSTNLINLMAAQDTGCARWARVCSFQFSWGDPKVLSIRLREIYPTMLYPLVQGSYTHLVNNRVND